MPYAIGKRASGVYEVVSIRARPEAATNANIVVRNGHAKIYDFLDEVEKECKAMNKERLAKHRELKKSQMELIHEP